MKKLLVFLCALTLVFGTIGVAGATPITFTDTTQFYGDYTDPTVDLVSYGGTYANKLEYVTDWVKWTHHFDFVPPAQEILNGKLTLALTDDENDNWRSPFTWDIGIGWAEDGSWGVGEVDTGNYSYDLAVSYLADGKFTVAVASLWGDFYIERAELEITYNPVNPVNPIPEPATMLLLGTGLIGLAWFGRKHLTNERRSHS